MKTYSMVLAGLMTVGSLAGCATPDQRASNDYGTTYGESNAGYRNADSNRNSYVSYGVVDSIQQNRGGIANSGVGAGTVIGGVVGGVLGNQVGSGNGRTVATVAGAAGGALIGHQVDKNREANNANYTVRVRLNNGDYQSITVDSIADLRVGDRVRIENNDLYRY